MDARRLPDLQPTHYHPAAHLPSRALRLQLHYLPPHNLPLFWTYQRCTLPGTYHSIRLRVLRLIYLLSARVWTALAGQPGPNITGTDTAGSRSAVPACLPYTRVAGHL